MNKKICVAAFVLGLLGVCWVALGYIGSNPLALTMTVIIGTVYVIGALELFRFHQATASLAQALETIPPNLPTLGEWLGQVHGSLQNPVRLRVEGERVGLPGPAVTPYLVGLLVMLGMLGTFLGLVVTLNGAVMALESTSDLQTIRASLAAPVKGLGLAFGTSVAGVAASAMLGLISALCRRERLQAGQLLDTRIATQLRDFSVVYQRQETFKALQMQAQALPGVADRMAAMMEQMERHSVLLHERLVANQERFYSDVSGVYSNLASAVDRSLKDSLAESARLAGATIQPAVEATMAGIAREATSLQARLTDTVQTQLEGLSARFDATVASVGETWSAALANHESTSQRVTQNIHAAHEAFVSTFEQRTGALLSGLGEAQAALRSDLAARDQQQLANVAQVMTETTVVLRNEWQQAGASTLAQQQQICRTLEQTAREITAQAQSQSSATLAEIARLMHAASEAPRAAADVIGQLREELSNSLSRDNALLEERSRIMETLGALLDAINHAAVEQRSAIDALVTSSSALLERASGQLTQALETETTRVSQVAGQVTASAVEVSSLGEAFGFAVQLFGESNEKLIASLQRIEGALEKSMLRSDDQLAYYVAQAREIIDLSLMSQKRIVDDLQQRADNPSLLGDQVR